MGGLCLAVWLASLTIITQGGVWSTEIGLIGDREEDILGTVSGMMDPKQCNK